MTVRNFKTSAKLFPLMVLVGSLMACGQSESDSSSVSSSRGSCHSKKAACEAAAMHLYPNNALDKDYGKKLRAYIAKSQECAQYVCENTDFRF